MAFKLGKLAPQLDSRDLKFSSLMRRGVSIPDLYDFDVLHPGIPTPMYLNDTYGDCVIAGRAHQTLRFELIEKGVLPKITDAEVEKEYFSETHGADSGLVVSQSLKRWRRHGWTAGGSNYKIRAYSRLDLYNRSQIKAAVYSDLGVGIGFEVPQSAIDQFDAGANWSVVPNDGGIQGGHYVFCYAYDSQSVKCVTWGRRVLMSWDFFDIYTDEIWAIFDAVDTVKRQAVLDVAPLTNIGG